MKINDIDHIKILDTYIIKTDHGDFKLVVEMNPSTEKEPTMKVTTLEDADIADEIQTGVIELFLSGQKPE